MDSTSPTLLERLRRPDDHDAWTRFVRLYTPLLYTWAERRGLQPADAADVTQEVLATLFQKLPEFRYDPQRSFRAWLHTVTINHWRDRLKRAGTRPLPGGDSALLEVAVPDGDPWLEEAEYRRSLVARGLQVLKPDFQPATWQAFWNHGVLGQPAADVAAKLGLSEAAVYGAKFRVLNRLRQELAGFIE